MYYNSYWMIGENEFSVVSGEEMEKNHAAYGIYGEIVPFNEAICIGNPIADFTSTAFIEERLCSLNTSYLIYKVKISSQLHRIPKDKDVNLVFGYDMFCSRNLLYLLAQFDYREFNNTFKIHILDEETMKNLEYYELNAKGFYELFVQNIINKNKTNTPIKSINKALDLYYLYKKHDKDTLLAMLNEYDDNLKALRRHREYGLPDYEWQKWLDAVITK